MNTICPKCGLKMELCVCEAIAKETGLNLANASRHLQVLGGANLVSRRKDGLQVFYRLSNPLVFQAYGVVRELAESCLAEVGRLVADFFGSADGLEPLDKSELVKRARRREVVVVDVRPAEEYASGHISGAKSLPLAELEHRLRELPEGRQVVAYCRGPFCVLAANAVRMLRKHGFDARRLEVGYPEWLEAGLPVENNAGKT